MSAEQCGNVDAITGLKCVYAPHDEGFHGAPLGDGRAEWQHWGTITIPGEVIDKWQQEAAAEGRESGREERQ